MLLDHQEEILLVEKSEGRNNKKSYASICDLITLSVYYCPLFYYFSCVVQLKHLTNLLLNILQNIVAIN